LKDGLEKRRVFRATIKPDSLYDFLHDQCSALCRILNKLLPCYLLALGPDGEISRYTGLSLLAEGGGVRLFFAFLPRDFLRELT
jgi:hypothetical protein